MENPPNTCEGFAAALGLQPESDGLFVGKIRGFPIGLKFIEPQGAVVILFQIRHWLMADAEQLKSLVYDEAVTKLVAEKKIQIEFDDRLAWLTLVDVDSPIEIEVVSQLLDSVLQIFEKADFVGDPELCHYCQKEKVSTLSTSNGKVAQICSICLGERLEKKARDTATPSGDAIPIFLMTPFAAIVGALLWAGCWFCYMRVMENSGSDTVVIPYIIIGLIIMFIGVVVGAPVGWIIRQNRRRGNVASASAAILFGSLAVVLGEIIYLAWLIWRWYGVFSISVAAKVLPDYYRGNDHFFLVMKFMAALLSVFLAYEMSKPKEAKLKL